MCDGPSFKIRRSCFDAFPALEVFPFPSLRPQLWSSSLPFSLRFCFFQFLCRSGGFVVPAACRRLAIYSCFGIPPSLNRLAIWTVQLFPVLLQYVFLSHSSAFLDPEVASCYEAVSTPESLVCIETDVFRLFSAVYGFILPKAHLAASSPSSFVVSITRPVNVCSQLFYPMHESFQRPASSRGPPWIPPPPQ